MSAAGQKAKRAAEDASFATSESFGLFMEGLRSLKKFTEESEKAQPDHTVLQQRLDDALASLGKCEIAYPEDSLPLYTLGLALTMKNQILYAEMLMKHGKESPRLTRSAPRRALEPIKLTTGEGGSEAHANTKAKGKRRKKEGLAGVYYVETEYLPCPADRPWPHLNHAADLFEKILKKGPSEMHAAAAYNLAHVWSKRDAPSDLHRAEALLIGINEPSPTHKPAAAAPKQGVFTRLSNTVRRAMRALFPGKPRDESAESLAAQEHLMTWLQSRTLLASVTARSDLKAMAPNKQNFYPGLATIALSKARSAIDKAFRESELPAVKKTDLEADYWTKAGFLAYNQAFAMPPDDIEFDAYLSEAESFLRHALDLKENWNPAQIYLAQVLQSQGRIEEAQKYLEAVVGKPPAPAAPAQTSPPATQTPAQTANPATSDTPEEERKV